MALNLDPRQRAMLQEMGITLWLPKPAAPATPAPPAVTAAPAGAVATVRPLAPQAAAAVPTLRSEPTPVQAPAAAPAPAAANTPPADVAAAIAWRMASAVQAYPEATGGDATDAWLVLWECPTPNAPFEGESGRLLNNMLRALRLHHSPHVWIAGMQRVGHVALPITGQPEPSVTWHDLPQGVADNVQRTRPARILLLGMHPARAVLGSSEPLGRLRAQIHQVHRVPTLVSYDPAYLLRSPQAKPAAWADLCRAHALRPPPAA